MAPTCIPGDARCEPCLLKAAQLIPDIYNYKDAEFAAVLKRKKAEIPQHWVPGWHQGNDQPVPLPQALAEDDSGIFCRMPAQDVGLDRHDQPVRIRYRHRRADDTELREELRKRPG